MGMAASGTEVSVDNVKASLLSLVPTTGQSESAFLSNNGRKDGHNGDASAISKSFKPRCYGCNQLGHIRRNCPTEAHNRGTESLKGGNNGSAKEAKFANAFSALIGKVTNDIWYIDSGASRHLTPNREILSNFIECTDLNVSIANGGKLNAIGSGTA